MSESHEPRAPEPYGEDQEMVGRMSQDPLFGTDELVPAGDAPRVEGDRRILVTVTTAPNPSSTHGETVCVAGIELGDFGPRKWIRLYPVNLRQDRKTGAGFRKYDLISVDCKPAGHDSRTESFNPDPATLKVESQLTGWRKRRPLVDPMIEDSMCSLQSGVAGSPASQSLGLIRPVDVDDFRIDAHTGWSPSEQAKIDRYVNQLQLFDDEDRLPLEAPAFKGRYRWRCGEKACKGHEQGLLDWEFVALQRNLIGRSDAEIKTELRKRFFDTPFGSERAPALYVGNLAAHRNTFMVLGVYYPKKTD